MNTSLIETGFHTLNIAEMANTTENALAQTRANLKIWKGRDTVRREGWYSTEAVFSHQRNGTLL